MGLTGPERRWADVAAELGARVTLAIDELRSIVWALREPDRSWDDTVAYLRGLTPADYARAAEAKITFGWMPGKYHEPANYVVNFAVPNFHFHLAHAYAILRHNGVDLGKMDYLAGLVFKDL